MSMLPVVSAESVLNKNYHHFLESLKHSDFVGDIETRYSSRLAVATDNSVYQSLPQGVVFPKSILDLTLLGKMASEHQGICFSARGGGTGTNGQSLTSGIIVDLSRHMNEILEFNQQEGWVRVQTGVIKDQLNAFLKPFGFFFAPDLSTSNRATIGGMINTDASGQGSLVYGKTSDHVLGLTSVLSDGSILESRPMPVSEAQQLASEDSRLGRICQQLLESGLGKRELIQQKFPRLNRFLTGYDLEHILNPELTQLDISRVITGSEGSLAFVAEAKLNVTPIARFKALINIKYDSFESALRHAPHMVAAQATSVETVDSKVLNLAREDIIWHSVSGLIEDVPGKTMLGLNMVEYNSNDQQQIEERIRELEANLNQQIQQGVNGVIGYQLTWDNEDILKIYAMRKKSVGLLGKTKNSAKPVAFAEDTAVPPENLADFILEFRALLDNKGLAYGMFGHVDAGVLHVRPALDLTDPSQEQLMQEISDQVVELVARYGGLMWGEHGKGYRSEYGPAFFGDELFTELRKIKLAFDPHNQMNPGKICTPLDSKESLVKVSSVKRGEFDRQIPVKVRESFTPAMDCNGNGLCFNYDASSPMCPSSKITGDRRHSPKGRATMVREWLRLLSSQKQDINALEQASSAGWLQKWRNGQHTDSADDFSHEVLEVMNGCLACKACTSQCPINVDVPGFRSRFLSMYYGRYLRPAKDHLVANIERLAPMMAKAPGLVNFFQRQNWLQKTIEITLGYVDAPLLSQPSLGRALSGHPASTFDLAQLQGLTQEQRKNKVILVQDPFTSFYEADLIVDLVKLVENLGYEPILMPFKPNGKPQHVKGFLREFARTAADSAALLNQLHKMDIPLLGVDPSLVLCYRDEYNKALGEGRGEFNVQLVHEWLKDLPVLQQNSNEPHQAYALFAHCSEKTALPASEKQWQQIFQQFDLQLNVVAVGCCGMAGTYGHEKVNLDNSKGLYELSWQQAVSQFKPEQILATGYSCRSQVDRMDGFKPKHPLQVLLSVLQD